MRNSTFLSECVTKLPRGSQVYTVTPTTHLVSLSQRLGRQSISEAEVLRHGELYYIRIRQNTSIEVYWDTEVQGGGNEWGEFSVGTCEYIPRPSWIVRVSKVLILSPLLRFWTLRIFTTSTSVSFRNDLLTFYQPRVLSKTLFLYVSLKSTTQYPFIPCTSLPVLLSLYFSPALPILMTGSPFSLPSAPSNLGNSLIPFPPFSHSLISPASTYPPQNYSPLVETPTDHQIIQSFPKKP